MSRASVFASVFALGVLWMLVASPVSAVGPCALTCTCSSSCNKLCYDDSPEFPTTCGAWDVCIESDDCTQSECPGVTVSCTSTLNGTASGDTLNGGTGHECLNGLAGNDTITGNAGDDTIHGGDGNDTMYGSSGNDCIFGDAGGDNANGDTGSDSCNAETEVTCEI